MAVAILDQANRRCRFLVISFLFIFGEAAAVMGTGWRKCSWSEVVTRRTRCSKSGYRYYNGDYAQVDGMGTSVSETLTEESHTSSPSSLLGDGRLVHGSKTGKTTVAKKLVLTSIPRFSVWADADDDEEAWDDSAADLGYFSGTSSRPQNEERNESIAEHGYFSGTSSRPEVKSTGNLDLPTTENEAPCDIGKPIAKEFSPASLVLQQSIDIAWLQEVVEYQKQHLAFLCGQVNALRAIIFLPVLVSCPCEKLERTQRKQREKLELCAQVKR